MSEACEPDLFTFPFELARGGSDGLVAGDAMKNSQRGEIVSWRRVRRVLQQLVTAERAVAVDLNQHGRISVVNLCVSHLPQPRNGAGDAQLDLGLEVEEGE